jgi:hypothetical protein
MGACQKATEKVAQRRGDAEGTPRSRLPQSREEQRERLRFDRDKAKLAEVVVERERLADPQTLHHRVARAVGEAPTLVGEALEDGPSLFEVIAGDKVKFRRRAGP